MSEMSTIIYLTRRVAGVVALQPPRNKISMICLFVFVPVDSPSLVPGDLITLVLARVLRRLVGRVIRTRLIRTESFKQTGNCSAGFGEQSFACRV